jgi:hypothetical protein
VRLELAGQVVVRCHGGASFLRISTTVTRGARRM